MSLKMAARPRFGPPLWLIEPASVRGECLCATELCFALLCSTLLRACNARVHMYIYIYIYIYIYSNVQPYIVCVLLNVLRFLGVALPLHDAPIL